MTTKPSPKLKGFLKAAENDAEIIPVLHEYLASGKLPNPYTISVRGGTGERRPDGWFHPSSHPLLTERQLYFYLTDPDFWVPEPFGYTITMSAMIGSVVHDIVETALIDLRYLIKPKGVCVACGFDQPRNCREHGACDRKTKSRGHMDGVLGIGGVLRGFEFKALDVHTPIFTPRGWTTMGELQEGDEVFAPDGQPTKVTGAHPVRHDRPCYKIVFADGQEIVADAEHLWSVDELIGRSSRSQHVVLTTREMVGRVKRENCKRGTYRFRVDLPEPLNLNEADLPIDPWLLGAWLGDGDAAGGRLTVGHEDLAYVTDRLDRLGETHRVYEDRRTEGRVFTVSIMGLRVRLRNAGVLGDKRIPQQYMLASLEQRRELLAGIMDTDGTISGHQIVVTMKKRSLMEEVASLVRSLGFKATLTTHHARLNDRDMGEVHRVQFAVSQGLSPFSLPRKTARVLDQPKKRRSRSLYNAIVAIEEVESRPTRCITVAHESSLYLVGRGFVPTHNTAMPRAIQEIQNNDVEAFRKKWPYYYAQVQEYMRMTGMPAFKVIFWAMGNPWDMREFTIDADIFFHREVETRYLAARQAVEEGVMPMACCNPGSALSKSCPARSCPVKAL